jgi:hypothetical protein
MTEDFCKRTARKTRKLGYEPKQAVRISRFCFVSMMSVSGMMGAMLDPSMKSMAGEEDESLLCLSARAQSDVMDLLNRSHGQGTQIARASITRFSDIQRRLPAL